MTTADVQRSWEAVATFDESTVTLAEAAGLWRDVRRLRGFLDGVGVALARRTAEVTPLAEQVMATASRISDRDAMAVMDRVAVVDQVPLLGEALADGTVLAGHVDGFRRALGALTPEQRSELIGAAPQLVEVAARSTVEEFDRAVKAEVCRIQADDGMSLLQQQRRDCRSSTWVNPQGMYCSYGQWDPVTGAQLNARIDAAVAALEAAGVPADAPDDPLQRQQFLRGLAVAALITGGGPNGGGSELVIVLDSTAIDEHGEPMIDWGIPVRIPRAALIELHRAGKLSKVTPVIVCDGEILHAPGRQNLERTSRLASRDQRRMLRALYPSCAIPCCGVPFGACEIHRVLVWEPPWDGPTNLDNLVPLCSRHHHRVHDQGWQLTLRSDRQLTIVYPDGTRQTTGPPRRAAAPGTSSLGTSGTASHEPPPPDDVPTPMRT